MAESILNGKSILAVDDEADVLTVLEEEFRGACPSSRFDKASTYEEAVERMILLTYDVVVLDIMGVRGFDLLELAVRGGLGKLYTCLCEARSTKAFCGGQALWRRQAPLRPRTFPKICLRKLGAGKCTGGLDKKTIIF